MSLWCKLGFHDYQKYREQKDVRCSRCGKRDHRHALLLLEFEQKAWMKLSEGEWSRETVDNYLNIIWEEE